MLNDFANQTGMLNSINTNDELKTLYKNYQVIASSYFYEEGFLKWGNTN